MRKEPEQKIWVEAKGMMPEDWARLLIMQWIWQPANIQHYELAGKKDPTRNPGLPGSLEVLRAAGENAELITDGAWAPEGAYDRGKAEKAVAAALGSRTLPDNLQVTITAKTGLEERQENLMRYFNEIGEGDRARVITEGADLACQEARMIKKEHVKQAEEWMEKGLEGLKLMDLIRLKNKLLGFKEGLQDNGAINPRVLSEIDLVLGSAEVALEREIAKVNWGAATKLYIKMEVFSKIAKAGVWLGNLAIRRNRELMPAEELEKEQRWRWEMAERIKRGEELPKAQDLPFSRKLEVLKLMQQYYEETGEYLSFLITQTAQAAEKKNPEKAAQNKVLIVDVTNGDCDFHCPHCRGLEGQERMPLPAVRHRTRYMAIEELEFAIQAAGGRNAFKEIRAAGNGEPTLHPYLGKLIELARNEGFVQSAISNGGWLPFMGRQSREAEELINKRLKSLFNVSWKEWPVDFRLILSTDFAHLFSWGRTMVASMGAERLEKNDLSWEGIAGAENERLLAAENIKRVAKELEGASDKTKALAFAQQCLIVAGLRDGGTSEKLWEKINGFYTLATGEKLEERLLTSELWDPNLRCFRDTYLGEMALGILQHPGSIAEKARQWEYEFAVKDGWKKRRNMPLLYSPTPIATNRMSEDSENSIDAQMKQANEPLGGIRGLWARMAMEDLAERWREFGRLTAADNPSVIATERLVFNVVAPYFSNTSKEMDQAIGQLWEEALGINGMAIHRLRQSAYKPSHSSDGLDVRNSNARPYGQATVVFAATTEGGKSVGISGQIAARFYGQEQKIAYPEKNDEEKAGKLVRETAGLFMREMNNRYANFANYGCTPEDQELFSQMTETTKTHDWRENLYRCGQIREMIEDLREREAWLQIIDKWTVREVLKPLEQVSNDELAQAVYEKQIDLTHVLYALDVYIYSQLKSGRKRELRNQVLPAYKLIMRLTIAARDAGMAERTNAKGWKEIGELYFNLDAPKLELPLWSWLTSIESNYDFEDVEEWANRMKAKELKLD